MFDVFCRRSVRLALCSLALSALTAAVAAPAQIPTAIRHQLSRVDVAVNGVGAYRSTVSGLNYQNVAVTQSTTNAFGVLATIRYTKSPLLGAEFNYSYARYSEIFTSAIGAPGSFNPLYVQTRASEYTFGYVAHVPKPIFGVRPFGAVGLGTTGFYPTTFGGDGLPSRARATYYYAVGAEAPLLNSRLGIRAQFRQLFFLAPDFGQNYLTIKQHTTASEPAVGIYVHF